MIQGAGRESWHREAEEHTFGSKAFNEKHHGRNNGAKRGKNGLNRAERDKRSRAKAKRDEAGFMAEKREEWEKDGAKLAKAQQAEDKAVARILADGAHALKIAKPHGNFTPEDVQAFQHQGWSVHPAGTSPAKVGSSLKAREYVEVNPGADPMVKILGAELEARAVVIGSPEPMSLDTIEAWRRAGYDVSPAPKKLRQGARVNPTPPVQRKLYEALKKTHGAPRSVEELATVAGIDPAEALASLGRLEALGLAHPSGQSLFGPLWAPGAPVRSLFQEPPQPIQRGLFAMNPTSFHPSALRGIQAHIAAVLKKETGAAVEVTSRGEDKWTLDGAKADVTKAVRYLESFGLMRLESMEEDPECGTFAYLSSQKPKKTRKNPSAENLPGRAPQSPTEPDTRRRRNAQAKGMARKTPKTPGKSARKATPPTDPESLRGLAAIWEKWTGAKASSAIELNLKGAKGVPARVVLLGRLAKLITTGGQVQDFGELGPLLVTDAGMKRVWMVDEKARRFDLDMTKGVICYHAKKVKFGDRSTVEYVHAFQGKARAAMAGTAGELSGSFRLTGRGIEG